METKVQNPAVGTKATTPATNKTANLNKAAQPAKAIEVAKSEETVAEVIAEAKTGRKLPANLSKSMLISIMHDAGWSVKEMVAVSPVLLEKKIIVDAFVEGHCRNSVRDFTANPHKAANARLVASATAFELPAKPEVKVAVVKPIETPEVPVAVAASKPASTTATAKGEKK